MRALLRFGLAALPWLAAALPPGAMATDATAWQQLDRGLELGEFVASQESIRGDSTVRIVRIDPTHYDLRLLNASAPGQGRLRTARQWAEENGLAAAINASMFQKDYRTSVSLMKTRAHTNQPRVSADKTILAFDPLAADMPAVQIIDRTCQNFDAERMRYGTLVQNIRMVSCRRQNVWEQQERHTSNAAVGQDGEGRVLFIHGRAPYTTHDFIDILLALPIDLKTAMYVEGGAQAQLFVAAGGVEREFVGSYGVGLDSTDGGLGALPIPNVIGAARRP